MARWDDIRRAILARDHEGTERLWNELLEAGPGDIARFLETARLLARQQGGKRQASVFLWSLIDALKGKEMWKDTLPVYRQICEFVPDDGTVRAEVIAAVQKGYADREDLELLMDKSGLQAGSDSDLPKQISTLERALRIEKDAYVYHKSGWGVGRVVGYDPVRGRCEIDFRTRPGHEMDIDAAARILERLPEDDVRVQAMVDPRGLRKRSKEEPLAILGQVVGWYGGSVQLKNVKAALVPDAVAPSTWSTWWKSARKHALMDPRFEVGPGRDPRIEVHEVGQADFRTQVEMALKRSATMVARQKAMNDLIATTAGNEEAQTVLLEVTERELERARHSPSVRLGWEIVYAKLKDVDPVERLSEVLKLANEPLDIVLDINDDKTRGQAAQAFLKAHADERPSLYAASVERDDPVLADAAIASSLADKDEEGPKELLSKIDGKPALRPNLYAWYLKAWRRGKWPEVEMDLANLVRRMLKVIDAVEYRQRRKANAKDKKAVASLGDLLAEKSCALMQEAAESTDEAGARKLRELCEQIRGLRAIHVTRLVDTIARAHPGAIKKKRGAAMEDDGEPEAAATPQRIYMTADGMARMRVELERIEGEEMVANRAEIARAREFGDLKENAEYHAAREKQGLLQAKVDTLKSDLARAVAITPDIVASDRVSVGTRVHLRDGGGEQVSYTLFGPPDTDPGSGVINYLTPLGQALMGTAKGAKVRLEIEGEVRELEVLDFEPAV